MKEKKVSGATPRKYDEAFKQEAVRLWHTSGRSAEATARELGISAFNLYKWGREGAVPRAAGALVRGGGGGGRPRGGGGAPPSRE
jgi:transposase-like protein